VRLTLFLRLAIGVFLALGGTALTASASTRAELACIGQPVQPITTVAHVATLAHVSTHDTPLKSSGHKLGIRRSSEPARPLLLSPGTTVSRLVDPGNAAPNAPSNFYQHLPLSPRASRAPPTHLS
jgi:hypothetical protein